MTYKKISKHTFIILIFALSMVILAGIPVFFPHP